MSSKSLKEFAVRSLTVSVLFSLLITHDEGPLHQIIARAGGYKTARDPALLRLISRPRGSRGRFKSPAYISSRFTRFSNLSPPAAQSSSNQSSSHCRADNKPTRWPASAHRAWAAGVIRRWEVAKQRPGERKNRVNALETRALCHEKLKRIESHACGFGCVERLAWPCQVHKSVHICLRV